MAYVDTEIASQPECWRRAVELAAVVGERLPPRGARVAAIGCGTSWFMAMAYAALRESAGHGWTDAFAASEFPAGRHYDQVVAISRSGTTTEVLDLVRALPAGTPTTALVADPASPLAELATEVVALPFADEASVVQTRFPTSALMLLRAHLAPAAADAGEALAADLPLEAAGTEQVTFLGRGWTLGLAHEAALKCREAARLWAEAYPAMDYRHGPITVAGPGRAVWMLGDAPPKLAGEVTRTGARFVHSAGRDPLAELVVAQRFAVTMARHRDLDPDTPRHLSRSVILR